MHYLRLVEFLEIGLRKDAAVRLAKGGLACCGQRTRPFRGRCHAFHTLYMHIARHMGDTSDLTRGCEKFEEGPKFLSLRAALRSHVFFERVKLAAECSDPTQGVHIPSACVSEPQAGLERAKSFP
jgi:hypothetical protein